MTVRAIFTAGALVEVGGSGYIPEGEFTVDGATLAASVRAFAMPSRRTLRAAALANDAALVQQRGALARAGRSDRRRAGRRGAQVRHIRSPSSRAFPALRKSPSRPNASATRPSISIRDNPGELRVFVKGAPEVLLAKSRYVWEDGKAVAARRGPPRGARAAQRGARGPGAAHAGHRHAHGAGRPLWASIRRPPPIATSEHRAAGQHRGRSRAARPRRHDRPAAGGGEGRRRHRQAGAHPHGDDHRRPSGDRRGDRPRARHLRAGGADS